MKLDHTRFKQDLRNSQKGVARVASWLSEKGRSIMMPGLSVAPTADVRHDSTDDGDLFILRRQEVKWISAEFTGHEDWPFGRHFIVTSYHGYEKMKDSPPENFFCLNKPMTHCGVVNVKKTKPKWYVQDRTDHYDNKAPFYFCPVDLVKFYEL